RTRSPNENAPSRGRHSSSAGGMHAITRSVRPRMFSKYATNCSALPISIQCSAARPPHELELQLLDILALLVLDTDLGVRRDREALPRNLDVERLAVLQCIGQATQLCDEVCRRIHLFHITTDFRHHVLPCNVIQDVAW